MRKPQFNNSLGGVGVLYTYCIKYRPAFYMSVDAILIVEFIHDSINDVSTLEK